MITRYRSLAVLALSIAVLLAAGFSCKRQTPPATTSPENVNTNVAAANVANGNANINASVAVSPISEEERSKQELGKIAMSFAERLGSYSNQSNFQNVVDLKPFMSKTMKVWADDYVAAGRAKPDDTSLYYGITTKSISSEVKQYDPEARAEFLVSTQRREATGTTANATVSYQNLSIVFVREQGAWRVDNATWQ